MEPPTIYSLISSNAKKTSSLLNFKATILMLMLQRRSLLDWVTAVLIAPHSTLSTFLIVVLITLTIKMSEFVKFSLYSLHMHKSSKNSDFALRQAQEELELIEFQPGTARGAMSLQYLTMNIKEKRKRFSELRLKRSNIYSSHTFEKR